MSRGLLAATLLLLFAGGGRAQTPRVLYVTHSAGYRHDSLELSKQILRSLSPRVEVTATEDLTSISDEGLRPYRAVFFFTSGELALSAGQKEALLAFVRNGGGFGGVHSATDTLYSWPEYGDLIGGYFEGHPWTEQVRVEVEDPDHPATRHLGASWTLTDEIYQFRNFGRDRVRVLMTLDMRSVDPAAPGAHRHTSDFPLAWVRQFGSGRVFYSALGHFESTWRDVRFKQMLEGALLWLTRQADGDATVRMAAQPEIHAVRSAAAGPATGTVARESWVSIYGRNLTSGPVMIGDAGSFTLAGASVSVDGHPARLAYASPTQLNLLVPGEAQLQSRSVEVSVRGAAVAGRAPVEIVDEQPGCLAVSQHTTYLSVWTTGLRSHSGVEVHFQGQPAAVLFVGPAPELNGVQQINAAVRTEWVGNTKKLEVFHNGRGFCEQTLTIN